MDQASRTVGVGLRRSARYGQEKLYIEVELLDIELGTELAHEVLGRSLDELSPQTRRFLSLLDQMAAAACERQGIERPEWRFSQREVREHTGWSDFAVKTHLRKLVELEYVLVHRSQRGQSFVYELLYRGEGTDGRPFVLGLIDVEKLRLELETPSRSDEATAASTTEPIQLEPERRDYDPDRAQVGRSRVFARVDLPGAVADGSTIDAEGHLWNAQWGGARVMRYRPDGTVDRIVPMPVPQPSCCAIGGPGLDTLYVITSPQGLGQAARSAWLGSGNLFELRLPRALGLPEGRVVLP